MSAGDWPAVTTPGGQLSLVGDGPDDGGTASPPAPETAGQKPGRVAYSADPIGHALPGHARRPPVGSGPATSAPGAPGAHDVCKAKRCGVKIRWAKTDTGEAIPVDYAPDPAGNLVRYMRSRGDWRVRVVKDGEVLDPSLTRWTSHFATCPEATKFRRRDQPRPAPSAPAAPALEVAAAPGPGVLLVVDGPSLGHRAFHAYERTNMRDPDGAPVWAIFGFLKLLVGVIERVRPDAVLVGFDDRDGSARRDRFPDYKAGRGERSEDLHVQLDQLPGLLGELGVATMTPPALEADDVLASAAVAAEAAGWRCVIATSDKDAFGLITEATTVLRLMDGLDNAVTMTPAALVEKYAVAPGQWRDYCALIGDKSDNLAGVLGIGPKTAVKLLAACGTLDAALADPAAAVAAVGKTYAGKLTADGAAEAIARNRDIMAEVNWLPFTPEAGRPHLAGGAIARVLKAWRMPSLIDRAVAALAVADLTGARLVPVPAAAPASSPAPRRSAIAPPLEQMAGEQAEVDRTCGECGEVCAARVPLAGGGAGETVLLVAEHMLGDAQLVPAGDGWAAERIHGYGGNRDNRRTEHRCTVYPGWCVTPGHDGRPARLYPGGWFCDGCMVSRINATRVVKSAGDQRPA